MAAVLCMGVLLSVFGGLSFVQVRATRTLAERVRAYAQIEDLGRSAIEEACAQLEDTLTPPPLGDAPERDLARVLSWPAQVAVPVTGGEGRAAGATVSPVNVRSSRWMFRRQAVAPGVDVACEVGILELAVRVKCGGTERAVVARRYASTTRRAGEDRLRVRIATEDLYLGTEAP